MPNLHHSNSSRSSQFEPCYTLAPSGYFYRSERKRTTDINDGKATACISAISETEKYYKDTRNRFSGYELHVYPLYTELKSIDVLNQLKNLKISDYEISDDLPDEIKKKRESNKHNLQFQKHLDPESYQNRLSPVNKKSPPPSNKSKRGVIKGMSQKSSIRLRKRASRIEDLALWIDFTFPDDVLEKLTITERAEFSYYCMKRIIKFAKEKFGLHIIWKRENKPRLSGDNVGEIMPHFHVLLGGLNQKQLAIWNSICIQLLIKWVSITGTNNPKALEVAINKKSFRRIENPKHATCYIAKYFSKDEPVDIPEGQTIGRCWGTSKNCPEVAPYIVTLSQRESFQVIRYLTRKKKLKSKRGNFLRRQLQNGYSTFLFEDETDIGRYLTHIGVDLFPEADIIPF